MKTRLASPHPALAPVGAVEDGAPHASEHPQAVEDVPHRGHHRQGGRPVGALVLAHHGHVHQAVHRRQHGAAKGRPQVFEIGALHVSPQQVHGASPLSAHRQANKKAGQGNRHLSLSPYPACHFSVEWRALQ